MESRKSGFLTFVFSFIPGAGEMYLGLMKKGIAVMGAFGIVFFLCALIRNGIFGILLPIIWFYSFFDTFNLKHLNAEQKIQAEEKFLRDLEKIAGQNWKCIFSKKRTLVGCILVFFGLYMLFQNLVMPILYEIEIMHVAPWLYRIIYNVPTLFVAIGIIWLGMRLVKGSEVSSEPKEKDFVEYEGDENGEK